MATTVSKEKDYTNEENRFQSFFRPHPWKTLNISPHELARCGFFYKGIGDYVECHSCGLVLHNWVKGDVVLIEHWKWRSSCQFLQNLMKNITSSNTTRVTTMATTVSKNKKKDYTKEENRLQSFSRSDPWKDLDIKPHELARCGFFYKGIGDYVECHSCGIVLHNWVKGDVVLIEHWKWRSSCQFLQSLMKISTSSNATNLCKPKSQDFRIEDDRLKSFYQYQKWPHTFLLPSELAMLGFYYKGDRDFVDCYFCKVRLYDWKTTDNVIDKHYRFFPSCPLLRGTTKENVPIDAERLNQQLRFFFYSKTQENDRLQKLEGVTQKLDKVKISPQKNETNDDSDVCKVCFKKSLIMSSCHVAMWPPVLSVHLN